MALEVLRKNDTLVVWKLDRLGRTVKGLIDLVNQLHQKEIHFKSITDNVDNYTPIKNIWAFLRRALNQPSFVKLMRMLLS